MKNKTLLLIGAFLLCALSASAQLRGGMDGSGDLRSTQTQSSVRVFAYDAAGNRISMGIPAQAAPAPRRIQGGTDGEATVTKTGESMVRVSVSGEDTGPFDICVYNAAGQLVVDMRGCKGSSHDISLAHLERGVYVMDVRTGEKHITRKFTKE